MFARTLLRTARPLNSSRVLTRSFAADSGAGSGGYGGGSYSSGSTGSGYNSSFGSNKGGMGLGTTSTNMNTWLLLAAAAGIPAYWLYSRKSKKSMAKENTESTSSDLGNNEVSLPGSNKGLKTLAGEATSSTMQNFNPTKGFNTSLTEILLPLGDDSKPIKAYRYIRYLNDDVAQSVIYDSDDTNAKLIGVEFHITDKLFDGLPADEKRLWHSHAYEVKSGAMLAPRLPDSAEKELMKQMAFTYGKAWSFWDTVKGDSLPFGLPKLLTSATQDGQLDPALLSLKEKSKN